MAEDERAVGAQVWEAVRRLDDAELAVVQAQILRSADRPPPAVVKPATSSASRKADTDADADAVALATADGHVQRWAPADLTLVFLRHLHAQLQAHRNQPSDGASSSGEKVAEAVKMATLVPPTAVGFELHRDEFPQLSDNTQRLSPVVSSVAPTAARHGKRRITTTLVTTTPVARPVPTAVDFPPLETATEATNSESTTRPPAWAKRSLLERRMGGGDADGVLKTPTKTTAWPAVTRKSEARPAQSFTPEKMARTPTHEFATPPTSTRNIEYKSPPRLQLVTAKVKRSRRTAALMQDDTKEMSNQQEAATAPSLTVKRRVGEATQFPVNAQAAKLYGFLITNRLAGTTVAELQTLTGLLYRTDCASSTIAGAGNQAEEHESCPTPSELCWRSNCLQFAELAFNCLDSVLPHLGPELGRLIDKGLEAAGICSKLRDRLHQLAKEREELRVTESARIGSNLPIQTKASTVRDFALPFCEETDSRLHYRSPADSQLYSNRERVRDSFLDLLRQFQKQQHSLLGIENAGVAAKAIESARALLADVAPENRWWFAKFFVLELVQVGSNPLGESDKDLVLKIMEDKLVGKNPDRLRKLHRRFTSQKSATPAPSTTAKSIGSGSAAASKASGTGVSTSNNARTTKSRGNSGAIKPSNRTDRSTNNAGGASGSAATPIADNVTAALGRMRPFFADSQLFFFHFLHSCDSFEFSQLVSHHLEGQFETMRTSKSPADPRKTFTEDVLKLKVVAKFVGYLRFSPLWQVSSSIVQRAEHNSAFTVAKKEAIDTMELAQPSRGRGLDVLQLLEDSIISGSIAKCVPWLCDYLSMLSLDKLSAATTYFKQLFVLLRWLYRSRRLAALGEVGLHIGVQIERMFRILELDLVEFMHDDQSQEAQKWSPSAHVRLALEDGVGPAVDDSRQDELPFLYNQVFIQTCISELDDLRGFIQARSAPSHRVATSGRAGSGSKSSITTSGPVRSHPIRKLRPLQVILEDNPVGGDPPSQFGRISDNPLKENSNDENNDFNPTERDRDEETSIQHDELEEAVFKSSPKLKSVVEFVVDAVATNVCNHVMEHVVTPRADAIVNRNLIASGLYAMDKVDAASEQGDRARQTFQQLMGKQLPREVESTVAAALDDALRMTESRVQAAVPALVPPSTHPTMVRSTVAVASGRSSSALRNLIPKTTRTEFLKRVALRNKSILRVSSSNSASRSSSPQPSDEDSSSSNVTRTLMSAFDDHAGDEDEVVQQELLAAMKQASAEVSRVVRNHHQLRDVHGGNTDNDGNTATTLGRKLSVFTESFREYAEMTSDSPEVSHSMLVWDLLYRAMSFSLQYLSGPLKSSDEMSSTSLGETENQQQVQLLVKKVAALLEAAVRLLAPTSVDTSQAATATQCRRLSTFIDLVAEWVFSTVPTTASVHGDHSESVVRMHALLIAALRTGLRDRMDIRTDWQKWRRQDLSEDESEKATHVFQRSIWEAIDTIEQGETRTSE